MSYIVLKNITKKIQNNTVLDNINLSLEKGRIYGLAGENGSGKTMLLRAIAGLIKTDGELTIGGVPVTDKRQRESIGIIIENIGLFGDLSAKENLMLLNSFGSNSISEEKICRSIEVVGLDSKSKMPYKKFSLGMKQKLCIAQAIMSHPDILLLDEPTNALDEKSAENFRRLIKDENERGATVIIASHNKDDLTLLCEKIYKMKNGCLEVDQIV